MNLYYLNISLGAEVLPDLLVLLFYGGWHFAEISLEDDSVRWFSDRKGHSEMRAPPWFCSSSSLTLSSPFNLSLPPLHTRFSFAAGRSPNQQLIKKLVLMLLFHFEPHPR